MLDNLLHLLVRRIRLRQLVVRRPALLRLGLRKPTPGRITIVIALIPPGSQKGNENIDVTVRARLLHPRARIPAVMDIGHTTRTIDVIGRLPRLHRHAAASLVVPGRGLYGLTIW